MANKEEKSIVGKIIGDIKTGAAAQHKIDSANFAAVKADTKARLEAAAAPNADFTEFTEAKGLKEKAAVVGKHLVRDGKERCEQSKKYYEEMLKKQREHINALTQNKK